jgi:hypothetical protein
MWRINELKQLGYHLDKSWFEVEDQSLDQFLPYVSNRKRSIEFIKGVVFTNESPKGEALKAFLRYTSIKPKKIVFVDDLIENIESVEIEARNSGIQFIGIEYTAIYNRR